MSEITNWEMFELLHDKLTKALPEIAESLEVDIHEAHCDKFSKEYDKFHELENEAFNLNKLKEDSE